MQHTAGMENKHFIQGFNTFTLRNRTKRPIRYLLHRMMHVYFACRVAFSDVRGPGGGKGEKRSKLPTLHHRHHIEARMQIRLLTPVVIRPTPPSIIQPAAALRSAKA
jgi:hypothetical protein